MINVDVYHKKNSVYLNGRSTLLAEIVLFYAEISKELTASGIICNMFSHWSLVFQCILKGQFMAIHMTLRLFEDCFSFFGIADNE